MGPNRWSAAFIIFLELVCSKIVLLDDIDAPEKHGHITIDSTKNEINHISRKVQIHDRSTVRKRVIPQRISQYEYENIPNPNKKIYNIQTERRYRLRMRPTRTVNTYMPIDRRIEGLLQEINRTQKEQETYNHTLSKLETQQARVTRLKKDKKVTEQSIYLTHNEINAVENALETLKLQLRDLNAKAEAITAQETAIEKEVILLQQNLHTKEALLHKLHRLKKKYKWLQSEYSYYDNESSDYCPNEQDNKCAELLK